MSETTRQPFSIRSGNASPKLIQRACMDGDLRNGLWNVFYACLPASYATLGSSAAHPLFKRIWIQFEKNRADEYKDSLAVSSVEKIILEEEWHRVFDLVEFVLQDWIPPSAIPFSERRASSLVSVNHFIEQCNKVLRQENSAYQIVQGFVAEITSEEEIKSIELAMQVPFDGVKKHIRKALALLADRQNPDYHNSIKESILAIESLAKEVTGEHNKTLGKLIEGLPLHHPAFQKALDHLYGFSSTGSGIRHGSTGEPLHVDQSTARFMLVVHSAFVNYIIAQNPLKPK